MVQYEAFLGSIKLLHFFHIDLQRIATFIHNWLLYYIIPRINLDKHHLLAFYFQSQFPCVPKMPQEKKHLPGDSKGPFYRLIGGHLTSYKVT